MTEKQLKTNFKKFLNARGIQSFMPVAGLYGSAGVADFICCINGFYIAVETKTEIGKQTALQKEFQRKIESAVGVYILLRPSNFDDVCEYFCDILSVASLCEDTCADSRVLTRRPNESDSELIERRKYLGINRYDV